MSLRSYRLALAASITLNVVFILLTWLYIHFEGLYSTIQTVIDIFG